MKHLSYFGSFLFSLFIFLLVATVQSATANDRQAGLDEKIASLELGINGYILGMKLPADKKEYSASHLHGDAYPGTYKFSDGELSIVASKKDDTVLALYQRREDTGIDQARKMISGLMGLFGEPTTMAHDQLIYWAYGEQGKISEEQYQQLRDKGERFTVLATVKFNSTLAITAESPDQDQTGTSYFIITSDPLLEDFVGR